MTIGRADGSVSAALQLHVHRQPRCSRCSTACGQENRYVAPPPPKVTVALPAQQKVTRYLEATGYTAAVNTTNLVARVQGFLQEINYKDGDLVKEGATLFVIEPEPYKLKLEQAQAAEAGRPGDVEAGGSGVRAAGRAREPPGRNQGGARQRDRQSRLRGGQAQAGAGRHQQAAHQPRLHPGEGAVRRHRHGAAGVAGRTGGSQRPDPARHHRPDRSDLRELQHQRAGRPEHSRGHAAARHHRGGAEAVSDRGRTADRRRISVPGHARLRRSRPSTGRPARSPCAPSCRIANRCWCRAISCACGLAPPTSTTRCWYPTPRSAATRAGATCSSSTRTTWSSSARSRSVPESANCA